MGKISVKHKRYKTRVMNKLRYPEALNERVLHDIEVGKVKDLIAVSVVKNGKNAVLESEIENYIPLSSYLGDVVSFREFLHVVHSVIRIIKECGENMMVPENLEYDSDYIFIEPVGINVKCILWPVVNYRQNNTAHSFFAALVDSAKIADKETSAKVRSYKEYFSDGNYFSLGAFEELVLELMGKATKIIDNDKSFFSSSNTTVSKAAVSERTESLEYNPFSDDGTQGDIICPFCGNENVPEARFCKACGNAIPEILRSH